MYTALVLTEESRKIVVDSIDIHHEGWEILFHHMTINMGKCKYPDLLGKEFDIKIVAYASDKRVAAYGVETECPSKNELKHITLAVNRSVGAKPRESNELTDWWPSITFPQTLKGIVKECE